MDNCLLFTCHTFQERSLCLHPNLASRLGIHQSREIQICFGNRRVQAVVDFNGEMNENEANLSSDIMNSLNIPVQCHFEIKIYENEFHIGPYIGLLAGYSNNSVKKKLDDLYDYMIQYRNINGMIIAFSLENIDKTNQIVEGYVFNPSKKQWEKGKFPYPSSIFIMTSSVSSNWIKHFKSISGDTVFNDYFFNKWEINNLFSSSIEVKDYLPEAILYKSQKELYKFLIKHPYTIVKSKSPYGEPILYNLSRDRKYISLSSLSRGLIKSVHLGNKDQAYSLFDKYFKKGEMIVQESLDPKLYRKIDFRLIMTRNENDLWENMGMFARQKVTNIKTKNIYPLIKLEKQHLIDYFQFSELTSNILMKEVIYIACDAIKILEQQGIHIADVTFDMTIDEKGRIRILDIEQCNPSHEIALIAGHPDLYFEILHTNMLYAKKLAGFPINN
ncbi:YheC/YheD family protein [Bacillus sp. BRMEA1]|uniref:YheC/YheD family protein n=1 Tax=Neobacillus endophyticus TaxID=2738405 RepID=UPI0015678388|nr:YheC/YheD family protein [Neobacillus endophyticus]NRD79438.1 YheC/YheD family protein [Neobacillus endophyticus]